MPEQPVGRVELASWCLAGAALLAVLVLHLLPAVIAGLLVYELVLLLAPPLQRRFLGERSQLVVLVTLIAVVIALLAGLTFGGIVLFQSQGGSVPGLLARLAEIIEGSRAMMPDWLSANLPSGVDELRAALSDWLREHARELRTITGEAGRTLIYVLLGMAIGGVLSLHRMRPSHELKPLAAALRSRAERFGEAFRKVMFAQVRISAINTAATAVYLAVLLPLLGIEMPFRKTLIAVTFVTGMLPVIGNLISNTVIVLVSLTVSLYVAIASLAFLVVIHKLEYFLNARIVGSRIEARAWELLVAMIAMEAAFGLKGLIAAPIYYAYVKSELAARGLV
jgi:predicted PurR-regulated permease PerM